MATVSGSLDTGKVLASSPAGQEVVPSTLCKGACVGPRAEASSVPDISGELLSPRQVCPGSKVGISEGTEVKALGMAGQSSPAVRLARVMT